MAIEITENAVGNNQFLTSRHFIAYSIGGGNYTITESGIVLLPNESQGDAESAGRQWTPTGFKGTSESVWRYETVVLALDLTQAVNLLSPPRSLAFEMDQWAPIASLNSIYNAGVSNDAGSAVRTFDVSQPRPGNSVSLNMDIAVRDTDGYLFRIGFYVTLVGRFVPPEDIP